MGGFFTAAQHFLAALAFFFLSTDFGPSTKPRPGPRTLPTTPCDAGQRRNGVQDRQYKLSVINKTDKHDVPSTKLLEPRRKKIDAIVSRAVAHKVLVLEAGNPRQTGRSRHLFSLIFWYLLRFAQQGRIPKPIRTSTENLPCGAFSFKGEGAAETRGLPISS